MSAGAVQVWFHRLYQELGFSGARAKPGQILISPRVLMKVENAVKVELVGEFELKGIRRPLAPYNVLAIIN
jgi:hypothetical protein